MERRGWSIDTGIDLLAAVVEGSSALPLEALADRIFEDVRPQIGSHDDIAFLIVRLAEVPQRLDVELPAEPAALAGLRRRLLTWLELRGLDAEECGDAVLAVSEACNNAIEHGYGYEPGSIHLVVEHDEHELSILVADSGTWRPAVQSDERGRGIPLMRAVMNVASVEHDGHGTSVTLRRVLA